ncbi:carbohydrate kinase [Paenibacillus sp. BR2-3]|uniref:carbohydrate kinase family protein n=1 Tax=Paenibacillus sp. BR2-3 TaxID=3048494 RepID=UPI0039777DF6
MQENEVLCVGELLIDFFCTEAGVNLSQGEHFMKQAGGAPANVAAAVSRLGGKAAFAGKVGSDPFGDFLVQTLNEVRVNTELVARDTLSLTTMAFVSLQKDGERDFMFNRGADGNFTRSDVPLSRLKQATIVHFGSATAMLGGSSLDAYFYLMENVKREGQFLSFDPNYRSSLWGSRTQDFVDFARKGASMADFVKVSGEELELITGNGDVTSGVKLLHELGARTVAVTLGREGTFFSNNEYHAEVPSIPVQSVDSTGAGDAFVGAVLFQLSRPNMNFEGITFSQWADIITFANKVGAFVCTKVGAISALPSYKEVEG